MDDLGVKKCYICGADGSDSVDHVPPKCLFAQKYRNKSLITVPAHKSCNSSFSKDDEYFRDNIIIAATMTSPAACELFDDKVIRTFQRKQAEGYRRRFIDQLSTVNIISPGGIYMRTLPIKMMEAERMDSVIARTCRGIYYRLKGNILPINCPVMVNMLKPEAIGIRHKLTGTSALKAVIPDMFEYIILTDNTDPQNNFFLLFFYCTFAFQVSTGTVAKHRMSVPRDLNKYEKLEGIHFTDETLWIPPGIGLV